MQTHIVSIGISSYKNPNINMLRCASTDAKRFLEMAEAGFGEQITYRRLLCDNEATLIDIKKAFADKQLMNASTNDTLIVYYSGHGARDDKEAYLANYDIDPDNLNISGISVSYFKKTIESCHHGTKIIILDCCHSGSVNTKSLVNGSKTKGITQIKSFINQTYPEGVFIFTACKDTESAYEINELDNSLFTHCLLKELTNSKRDKIALSDLVSPVVELVKEYAEKSNIVQTPTTQLNMSGTVLIPKFGNNKRLQPDFIEVPTLTENTSHKANIQIINSSDKKLANIIQATVKLFGANSSNQNILASKSYISKAVNNLKEWYLRIPKEARTYDEVDAVIEDMEREGLQLFIISACAILVADKTIQSFFAKQASSILEWQRGQSGSTAILDIANLIFLIIMYIQMECSLYNESFAGISELLSQGHFGYYRKIYPIYDYKGIHYIECLRGNATTVFDHILEFSKKQIWLQNILGIDEKEMENLTLQSNLLLCATTGYHTSDTVYPSYYKYDLSPIKHLLYKIGSDIDYSENLSVLFNKNKSLPQVFTDEVNKHNDINDWTIFDKLNPSDYLGTKQGA